MIKKKNKEYVSVQKLINHITDLLTKKKKCDEFREKITAKQVIFKMVLRCRIFDFQDDFFSFYEALAHSNSFPCKIY